MPVETDVLAKRLAYTTADPLKGASMIGAWALAVADGAAVRHERAIFGTAIATAMPRLRHADACWLDRLALNA